MRIRVEYVIIIADHSIDPCGNIERKFKRTDFELLSLPLDCRTVDISTTHQHIIDCIIYPVKMPLCIRARLRITDRFPAETDFFFCCESDHFHTQPLFFHRAERVLCNRSGDRFRCKIENFISQTFSDCFYSRKHRRDRLPYAGGGLDKQFLSPQYRPVDCSRNITLPRPIVKWELRLLYRSISFDFPFNLESRPFFILADQIIEPFFQFFCRVFYNKSFNFFRIKMAVSHLNFNLFQPVLRSINVRVTFRLCQVYFHRLCYMFQLTDHTFDLVNDCFFFFVFSA